MDIVTIDFETYYDKDYSLTKMTTEAYVRDPRFEVIGVGIQVNDNPPDWYSGDNPGKFLKSLDYSKRAILCHNTAFDGAILSWHFGIKPRLWLDTLSMARPYHSMTVGGSLAKLTAHYGLGAKGTEVLNALGKRKSDFTPEELARYGEYCINDVDLTYKLFQILKMGFPVQELLAIDQTLRMYTEPVIELDVPLLEKHLEEVRARKAELMASVSVTTEDIMSNAKFAVALQALGVEPPTKTSNTTGKSTWAFAKTDKGMTELLEHPDDRVQALVSARLGVKSTIEETRTEALIGVAGRGRLPIMLNYYGAHTGRFSGGDKMNLQNLPARGSSNAIRRSLKAPEGQVIIASDSSQIEARMVAYIAGQDDLVQAFREGRDVYSEFATEVYGRKITKADKTERFVGKAAVLSLGYGAGAAKFKDMLRIQGKVEIELNEAERIVRIYRAKNFRIVQLWQKCGHALTDMVMDGYGNITDILPYDPSGITLPNKMQIKYPALRATTSGFEYIADPRQYAKRDGDAVWTRIYGGKVVENCIAEGTQVLTDRGWVSIESVRITDKVHDGIEFVEHSGLVSKSIQPCVNIDGVYMTPDHEVLTDEGWKAASQNPKPYRPDIRYANGGKSGAQRWKKKILEVPVSMWGAVCQGWSRCSQRSEAWRHPELRMFDTTTYIQSEQPSRYVKTSSVRRMAQHVRQVQTSFTSSVEKLRRSWDQSVHTMARVVRELLVGYGDHLPARTGFEPQGQRRGLFPGELRVDEPTTKLPEQTKFVTGRHHSNTSSDRHIKVNALLPTETRAVFDIINAGPRHRFVVRGSDAPFIVHNCVQALAAIVIREQMVAIGQKYHVAFQVHDEIIITAPEAEADEAEAKLVEVMSTPPKWAPGLPVACESGKAVNYGDT